VNAVDERQIGMLRALGAFRLSLGDSGRALALLAAAFEAVPNDGGTARLLIRSYIAAGQGEAALSLLDALAAAGIAEGFDTLRCEALWLAGRRDEARALRVRCPLGAAA
jgi:thioredoxin-like negative regulator of GroEL